MFVRGYGTQGIVSSERANMMAMRCFACVVCLSSSFTSEKSIPGTDLGAKTTTHADFAPRTRRGEEKGRGGEGCSDEMHDDSGRHHLSSNYLGSTNSSFGIPIELIEIESCCHHSAEVWQEAPEMFS